MKSRAIRYSVFLSLLTGSLLLLASCTDIIGVEQFSRNSGVDPESGEYQGYPTVEDTSDFSVVAPREASEGLFIPELLSVELLGGTEYQFQISSDEAFTSPELESGSLDENRYAPANFKPADLTSNDTPLTYYWRARGRDADGQWSEWAPSPTGREFSYLSPVLTFSMDPSDGDTTPDTSPELSWQLVQKMLDLQNDETYQTGYQVRHSNVSASDLSTADTHDVDDPSYEIPAGDASGTTYYWQVRARITEVNSGKIFYGAWSPVSQCTSNWEGIQWNPSPSDGVTVVDEATSLEWDPVPGAASYEIRTADTSVGLSSATTETAEIDYLYFGVGGQGTVGETYYWQIRGVNEDGNSSPWSEVFSFTIGEVEVVISMFTGSYPQDIYWEVVDENGEIARARDPNGDLVNVTSDLEIDTGYYGDPDSYYSSTNSYSYTDSYLNSPDLVFTWETGGEYTLKGYDAFGDGWEGGSLDLKVNESTVIENFTVEGYMSTESFVIY